MYAVRYNAVTPKVDNLISILYQFCHFFRTMLGTSSQKQQVSFAEKKNP